MIGLDLEKLEANFIDWCVVIGGDAYVVPACSAASAIRQCLIEYLGVEHWDDEGKDLFLALDLADILDALPDALTEDIYAYPDFEAEDDDEGEDSEPKVWN